MSSDIQRWAASDDDPPSVELDEVINDIGFGRFQFCLVVVLGLCQIGDSMEMLLLSVIGPQLRCQWSLTNAQLTLITTIVLLGMAVGGFWFGVLADKCGRLRTLCLGIGVTVVYGLLSALSPSYVWLLVERFFVGVGIGGINSSLSILFTELMPRSFRGKGYMLILTFWTFGSLLESGLATLILPTFGWRWLLLASGSPILVCFIGFAFLPESPHFLLLNGESDQAIKAINRIARCNNKPLFRHQLVPPESTQKGRFQDLFHPNYRLVTCVLSVIWFSSGFAYYGSVFLSTTLPLTPHRCLQNWEHSSANSSVNSTQATVDASCCQRLVSNNFLTITIASLGDISSFFFTFFISEVFGRRWALRISPLLAAVSFVLLDLCFHAPIKNVLFFFNRAFSNSSFLATFLYTAEVFPTSVRSLGFGFCSALGRFGAVNTPFISQIILKKYSVLTALTIYAVASLCGFIGGIALPIETKDRFLLETVYSKDDHEGSNLRKKNEDKKEDGELNSFNPSSKRYFTFKREDNLY